MHGMMKQGKMKARMEALMELLDLMEGMEQEEFEGMDNMPMPESMKKVTVAAPDEEGLKQGLSKADELLEKYKDMEETVPMGKKKLLEEDEEEL